MIAVSPDRRYFVADGRPFFYLADTVWAAFYGTQPGEWEPYLRARREQGFNTLQISVLPILHDCERPLRRAPFAVGKDGAWDLNRPDDAYFAYAVERLREARAMGFKISLTLLWGNYVPGNWMSKNHPGVAMDDGQRERFIRYVAERFAGLYEFCFLSGDVDFTTPENEAAYLSALRLHKRLAPEVLTSLHSAGRNTFIPEAFLQAPELDFYVYQSGHGGDTLKDAALMAPPFLGYPARPLVNAEPCYEAHGNGPERFRMADVFYVFWQSVLAGAVAGFTYGAHGVWSWHAPDTIFGNAGWSKDPFYWQDALRLPGAARLAANVEFFLRARGWETAPWRQPGEAGDGVVSQVAHTALAVGPRSFLLHLPAPSAVELPLDLAGYDLAAFAPESGVWLQPTWHGLPGGRSRIAMLPLNENVVVAGVARDL